MAVKKKRKPKTRTENKFRGAIVSYMRKSFAMYSPKYGEIRKRCRVEVPKPKKGGGFCKVPDVWHRCEQCGELTKKLDVDHKDPIIPIGMSYSDMTLDEIYNRLNCDINNLWGLCKDTCHHNKTMGERLEREKAKKAK